MAPAVRALPTCPASFIHTTHPPAPEKVSVISLVGFALVALVGLFFLAWALVRAFAHFKRCRAHDEENGRRPIIAVEDTLGVLPSILPAPKFGAVECRAPTTAVPKKVRGGMVPAIVVHPPAAGIKHVRDASVAVSWNTEVVTFVRPQYKIVVAVSQVDEKPESKPSLEKVEALSPQETKTAKESNPPLSHLSKAQLVSFQDKTQACIEDLIAPPVRVSCLDVLPDEDEEHDEDDGNASPPPRPLTPAPALYDDDDDDEPVILPSALTVRSKYKPDAGSPLRYELHTPATERFGLVPSQGRRWFPAVGGTDDQPKDYVNWVMREAVKRKMCERKGGFMVGTVLAGESRATAAAGDGIAVADVKDVDQVDTDATKTTDADVNAASIESNTDEAARASALVEQAALALLPVVPSTQSEIRPLKVVNKAPSKKTSSSGVKRSKSAPLPTARPSTAASLASTMKRSKTFAYAPIRKSVISGRGIHTMPAITPSKTQSTSSACSTVSGVQHAARGTKPEPQGKYAAPSIPLTKERKAGNRQLAVLVAKRNVAADTFNKSAAAISSGEDCRSPKLKTESRRLWSRALVGKENHAPTV